MSSDNLGIAFGIIAAVIGGIIFGAYVLSDENPKSRRAGLALVAFMGAAMGWLLFREFVR